MEYHVDVECLIYVIIWICYIHHKKKTKKKTKLKQKTKKSRKVVKEREQNNITKIEINEM